MTRPIRYLVRSLLLILTLSSSAGWPATATAETAFPTVTIGVQRLDPPVTSVDGGVFMLSNRSSVLARVEFRIPHGTGIACSTNRRTPILGRKFVLDAGDTLLCHAIPGRYDFTVYKQVRVAEGVFELNRFQGRIEVARDA